MDDCIDRMHSQPCRAYGESMAAKARRIRKQSLEGGRVGWKLQRLIMKSNDDVRQEVFIMQVLGCSLAC